MRPSEAAREKVRAMLVDEFGHHKTAPTPIKIEYEATKHNGTDDGGTRNMSPQQFKRAVGVASARDCE